MTGRIFFHLLVLFAFHESLKRVRMLPQKSGTCSVTMSDIAINLCKPRGFILQETLACEAADGLLCGSHTRVNISYWILEQEKGCCSINQPKSSYILARHYIQKSSIRKHGFPRIPDIWYTFRKKLRILECLSETPSPGGLACISQPARFTYRYQSCIKITSMLEYIHLFYS